MKRFLFILVLLLILFVPSVFSATNTETARISQTRNDEKVVHSVYHISFRDTQLTYSGIIVLFMDYSIRVRIMENYMGNYYDQVDETGRFYRDSDGNFHFECTKVSSWELKNSYHPDHFILYTNGGMVNFSVPNTPPLPVAYRLTPKEQWESTFKSWRMK